MIEKEIEFDLNLPSLRQIKRLPLFKPLRPKQIKFLIALFHNDLQVAPAARSIKSDWRGHYRYLEEPTYKQAYEYIKEMLGDKLESTLLHDALHGRDTAIVYKGKVTGFSKETNASERIVLLKGLRPRYREYFSAGSSVGPVQVNINLSQNTFSPLKNQTVLVTDETKVEPADNLK